MIIPKINAWNVGPRSHREILWDLNRLTTNSPAKITVLFEASDPKLVAGIKVLYPHKRVICRRTDTVAIIPRTGPQPRIEIVGHGTPWRGPKKGNLKHGRSWLLLVWEDVAVLPIHRVTPIGNEQAWEADHQVIRNVVRRTDLPDELVIPGDHNGTDDRLCQPYNDLGLRLLPANSKVDQCATRDVRGQGVRLGDYDSDHVAMAWHLQ